jgi:hypothetical protein
MLLSASSIKHDNGDWTKESFINSLAAIFDGSQNFTERTCEEVTR